LTNLLIYSPSSPRCCFSITPVAPFVNRLLNKLTALPPRLLNVY